MPPGRGPPDELGPHGLRHRRDERQLLSEEGFVVHVAALGAAADPQLHRRQVLGPRRQRLRGPGEAPSGSGYHNFNLVNFTTDKLLKTYHE